MPARMSDDVLQLAKQTVRALHTEFDAAPDDDIARVLEKHTSTDYSWRGVHPFNEQRGVEAAINSFWLPLRQSLSRMQRREDVFMAGKNDVDKEQTVWVAGMGHMMGLFDNDWLGIPATGKLTFLRYAEFHRVHDGRIAESAFFCDILSIMDQAGCYPLQSPTGAALLHPGPRTHDGLLFDKQSPDESAKTLTILNKMINDLSELNKSGVDDCTPEVMRQSWHDDMVWYGPTGIGATYTIPRYQQQHQIPFRTQLKDKVFNGHVTRFAESSYAGFFGWPNLTNTPTGGFLGLPANETRADMRVVDIYRREGDKLVENWVFIDFLHWMKMQGVDVLPRQ